jgi:glycosyltransferase involved in cell wall biosynthesis
MDWSTAASPNLANLGVVIPCYNEAQTVDELIGRVLRRPEVTEVVVVDDGSSDGTWDQIKDWPAHEPRVRILRHRQNRGKGAALRTGFREMSAAVIVVQDADLEYDPDDYRAMLELIVSDRADVVYGSRFLIRSGASSPWWHRQGNRMLTQFCNRVTGLRLSDQATCFKMFRRSLLDRLALNEDGFGFCPEFTVKVAQLGLRIAEVPVTYRGRTRAEGKKIRLRHGLEAVACVIKYRFLKDSLRPEP